MVQVHVKRETQLGMSATVTELRAWRASGTTLSSVKCVNESNVDATTQKLQVGQRVHKEEKSLYKAMIVVSGLDDRWEGGLWLT